MTFLWRCDLENGRIDQGVCQYLVYVGRGAEACFYYLSLRTCVLRPTSRNGDVCVYLGCHVTVSTCVGHLRRAGLSPCEDLLPVAAACLSAPGRQNPHGSQYPVLYRELRLEYVVT